MPTKEQDAPGVQEIEEEIWCDFNTKEHSLNEDFHAFNKEEFENFDFHSEHTTDCEDLMRLMYVNEMSLYYDNHFEDNDVPMIDLTLPKYDKEGNRIDILPSHHIHYIDNLETVISLIDSDVDFLCRNFFIGVIHYMRSYYSVYNLDLKKVVTKEYETKSETYNMFWYNEEENKIYRYVISPKKWEHGVTKIENEKQAQDFLKMEHKENPQRIGVLTITKDLYNSTEDYPENIFRMKIKEIVEEPCLVNNKPIISLQRYF